METTGSDTIVLLIFCILCLGLLVLFVFAAVRRFLFFYDELWKINMEISRTTGAEQAYWKRERRRAWRLLFSRNR